MLEFLIEQDVEGVHLAILDVVPHLPANRALPMQEAEGLRDGRRLLLDVNLVRRALFVRLPQL